ncbi:MAG: Crp/Fnr family transcriptional regulator [Planctomycetota bacterium]|nr:Crp/Fnr family transcriptional regulator [Planctomycetota bacterium]MDI6787490.1 Crp/Fnr family transcriptional regulator [Planctomycetota bacterium]
MKNPNVLGPKDYEKILKQVPLFSGLNPLDLERVSRLVIRRKVSKGQIIITEGQELDGFYIVISGLIKIYKLSSEGKEQILHLVKRGDTFAEVTAFVGKDSPANALAMTDSEVFFLFGNDLLRLVKDNPQISLNMLASMSQYLRRLVTLIEEISLKDVPTRLSKYLLDLAVSSGVTGKAIVEVQLPTTKKELASRLGTISETLSRALNKFKSKKVIRVSGNRITILNKARLEEISSGAKI